jgi:hypothetical protein
MVFDWDRAARRIQESGARSAAAGLRDDWGWTGGPIWADGPYAEDETYTYLASTWAVPELDLDGTIEECWTWQDETEWDAGTYWPESARTILLGKEA